jgi:hypothetical protein
LSNLLASLKACTDDILDMDTRDIDNFLKKVIYRCFRLVKFAFDFVFERPILLLLSVQRAIYELHIEGLGIYPIT